MSANVCWRPANTGKKDVPDDIHSIIRDLRDGANYEMDYTDITYLEGLRDGGCKGAQKLIDAINKHEEIDIIIEY